MEIRKPEKEEVHAISDIHLKAFDVFFLSELGSEFLSTYYNTVRENNRGVLLGCFEDNKLLGFCAATTLSEGFNKHLVKSNFFSFSKIGLFLLFSRPKALLRLLKNFTKSDPSVSDDGHYAELLSIGVSPTAQGKGVGKKLLMALEEYLNEMNVSKLSLTTDFYDNEKTLNFYKGLGYDIMYDFVAYPDRRMYRLIKKIQQ
ncbi:MAG: GNAT family N-acetyltransferase [Candidatus Cloacimonetes bacterium]|nr:GNAT family N-acetyltransferase [Candidatus Cloacimonadota bacterium]